MKKFMRYGILMLLLVFVMGFATHCASRTIYVRKAPPKVRVEVRPAPPFKAAVWIPGHWQWKHGRYVWVPGRWIKARRGYAWVPGHWAKRPRGWVWIPGHWKRVR